MNFEIILHAGVATGTILLFAAIGEIFAERAGILNLGVEGMMLLGAMAGFSTSLSTGNAWLGLVVAMIVVWQNKMVKGMLSALGSSYVVVLIMMVVLFRSLLWGVWQP